MSNRRRLFLSLFVAGAMVLGIVLLASGGQASPYEPTRYTVTGSHVAIYNLVGSLEVVRGDGASVVAEVTLKGKDAARRSGSHARPTQPKPIMPPVDRKSVV